VTNADNDNSLARHFIEDQIRIRRRRDPAQATFACELAALGVLRQQSGDCLNAPLNVARALGSSLGNEGENVGQLS